MSWWWERDLGGMRDWGGGGEGVRWWWWKGRGEVVEGGEVRWWRGER